MLKWYFTVVCLTCNTLIPGPPYNDIPAGNETPYDTQAECMAEGHKFVPKVIPPGQKYHVECLRGRVR